MDNLKSQIYHETQQPGSMLCAQHALNNLLQGNYFSAPDLATIAQHLDDAENMVRDPVAPGRSAPRSRNMDDTGFFSIQVLENALSVWGLTLVRWRSEDMRPYQNIPELQPAFILNLEQHWYTLRRFGPAGMNYHWFNLNSSLDKSEWISNTYLGMTLQQAEQEGYSVFAVRPINEGAPNALDPLPESTADNIAAGVSPATRNLTTAQRPDVPGDELADFVEDEDLDLQRVLQESLLGAQSGQQFGSTSFNEQDDVLLHDSAFNAFQASAARQRDTLAQARMEQEMALRETMAAVPPRRRTTGDDEEDEMLRRAMEESLATASANPSEPDPVPARTSAADPASVLPPSGDALARGIPSAARVLDDEDAELQAALKASLADMPEGFMVPDSPPPSRPSDSRPSSSTNVPQMSKPAPPVTDDDENIASAPPSPEQEKPMSMDEIRRMRLARFGN